MKELTHLLKNLKTEIVLEADGWSMYPTLKPKDLLTIYPCKSKHVYPGDIVAIYNSGKIICHRVLVRWDLFGIRLFFEKGDNQPFGNLIMGSDVIRILVAVNNQSIHSKLNSLRVDKVHSLIFKSLLSKFLAKIKGFLKIIGRIYLLKC